MRSTDFPFAVMPQGYAVRRFREGGASFAAKYPGLLDLAIDEDFGREPTDFAGRDTLSALPVSGRDRLKDKLAVMIGRSNAERVVDGVASIADFTPAGAVSALDESVLALRKGNRGEAVANLLLGVLPLPGPVKKAVKGAAGKVTKAIKGDAPTLAVKPDVVEPLALNEESRMARAANQGYLPDRLYHGRNTSSQIKPKDNITFYSRDPEYAAGFGREGGSVYEYRVRPQKMLSAKAVNFGAAADIIEGLIKAKDEIGAARVMSGIVDFPGTPQQFVAAARRAPEKSLGVSAAAIQHLLSKNSNTTWESALRSAGFDAYDTGRDVVMLTSKGQRRVDAMFDPRQINATGVTKARGGLAVLKGVAPFAVNG